MRTTAGRALAAAVAGLLSAGVLAAPAPAASLDAPGSAAPGESVAVTVDGLARGVRFALFLARDDAFGLPCLARIARRTARDGEPTVFSGIVPTGLSCQGGIPSQVPLPPAPPGAPVPVEPGHGYRFLVCVPAGQDCDETPVARRGVTMVPPGRECGTVVFTPNSDHGAFNLHARHVGCRVGRRVARGVIGGDLGYRRAGLRCRGVFDPAGLPKTVYRCTRPGARVTFVAS